MESSTSSAGASSTTATAAPSGDMSGNPAPGTGTEAVQTTDTEGVTTEAPPEALLDEKAKENPEEQLRERLDRYEQANARLVALFNQNPEIPQLLSLMDQGATFAQALPHVLDVNDLVPAEGDPDFDTWDKAAKEREKKRSERDTYLKQIDQNLQMSQAEVDAFVKENNLEPEVADKMLKALDDMVGQVLDGKVDKNFLKLLMNAINFDQEVETARRQGEIKGKNEKIVAEVVNSKKGDNLPDIGSGGEAPAPAAPQEPVLFGAIDKFNKKQHF